MEFAKEANVGPVAAALQPPEVLAVVEELVVAAGGAEEFGTPVDLLLSGRGG